MLFESPMHILSFDVSPELIRQSSGKVRFGSDRGRV